jgi:beta-phosphoglucomutase-like phosphatase (HAD superfamily)
LREALGDLGAPVCVASSSPPERIRASLRIVGYADLFGARVFSAAEVTRGKPAPDLFLHAARQLGAPPAACLVIEDSAPGVVAARRAGMTAFGFTGGAHAHGRKYRERLAEAGAVAIFDDMRELPALIASTRKPSHGQDS